MKWPDDAECTDLRHHNWYRYFSGFFDRWPNQNSNPPYSVLHPDHTIGTELTFFRPPASTSSTPPSPSLFPSPSSRLTLGLWYPTLKRKEDRRCPRMFSNQIRVVPQCLTYLAKRLRGKSENHATSRLNVVWCSSFCPAVVTWYKTYGRYYGPRALHSGAFAQSWCFLFSWGSSGYQLSWTIAAVSAQQPRPVEHVKKALRNIATEQTPQSVRSPGCIIEIFAYIPSLILRFSIGAVPNFYFYSAAIGNIMSIKCF